MLDPKRTSVLDRDLRRVREEQQRKLAEVVTASSVPSPGQPAVCADSGAADGRPKPKTKKTASKPFSFQGADLVL